MPFLRKIVLHSLAGYRPELDGLVQQFIVDGVIYVGVVGVDASRIEDIIMELCVGDGSAPYQMLNSFHENETLPEVVAFAQSLTGEYAGDVQVVEF
jgi:hypothetical protein